jgi:predicted RNA-binding Zn ribbon-like protein
MEESLTTRRHRRRSHAALPRLDCGWLFIDASGRWCSMETCGSRATMRRLRSR